jgi:hypothetical protein
LDDAHAVAFDAGDNDYQVTAYAPTWLANPTITEEDTHRLEPDERRWRREYLAIAQAGALAAFDPVLVARAFGEPPEKYIECSKVVLVDPTAGSSDTYAIAVCGWRMAPTSARYRTVRKWVPYAGQWIDEIQRDEKGGPIENPDWEDARPSTLVFDWVTGVDQAAARGYTSAHMVAAIVKNVRSFSAVAVHSDQFERFSLASMVGAHGVAFIPHTWTAPLKERAVERVRGWLRDGTLLIREHATEGKHEQVRKELLAFEERIAPSGALTFRGRQGGRDDFAMLVMLAALVDIEGQLPGSPIGPTVYRDLQHLPPA